MAQRDHAVANLGGGKTVNFRYEYNSLCDAEPITRVNLLSAQDHLMAGDDSLTANELRGLVYAMILPDTLGFPKDDQAKALLFCGDLIRPDIRAAIMEGLAEAIAIAISVEYAEEWRRKVEAVRAAAVRDAATANAAGTDAAAEEDNSTPASVASIDKVKVPA